jgi:RsiW-degrading membrane proteinase PrsW (M82 family)
MSESTNTKRITTGFNLLLFAYSFCLGFLGFIFSDKAKNVPITGIIVSTFLDTLRFLVVVLIGAWLLREFWDRLIVNLLPIRGLRFEEAIAIILIISVMFGR